MGVRYRAEFTSDRGIDWKVDIHDSSYSSTVNTFNIYDITFNYPTESNEISTPFIGSEVSVMAFNENAGFDTLLTNIATSQEERFSISIYKDTVFNWCGFILTDLIEMSDSSKPYDVVFSATDGIARLKDVDYPYALDSSPSFIKSLQRIIDETNLSQFWAANDDFLFTSVDWWDTNHPARAYTVDPLLNTLFDPAALIIRNDGEPDKYQSAYEVLKQLCYTFDARFFLSEGMWRFVQINQYEPSTIFTHVYNKSSVLKTDANNTNLLKTIDKVSYWKEAGGVDAYLMPLQAVKVDYNLFKNSLLLPLAQSYSTAVSIGTLIQNQSLLFKCIINEDYIWNGAAVDIFRTKYDVQIILTGTATTYYLKGSNLYGQREWTTTNTDVYEIYTGYRQGKDWESDFAFAIQTKDIPVDCTATFRLRKIEHQDRSGSTLVLNGTYTYFIRYANLSYVDTDFTGNNNPILKSTWQVTNTDGINPVSSTYILKLPDKIFGDGGVRQTGGLIVKNGANQYASTSWDKAAETNNLDITNLLLQEVISRRKTSTKTMESASFIGDIPILYKISYDSIEWVFLGGSFSAINDQWSGIWFEIKRSVTNLDVEDVIGKEMPIELGSSSIFDSFTKLSNSFIIDEESDNVIFLGSFGKEILNITSDTTLTESNSNKWILINSTSGAITLTLPLISGLSSNITYEITIINADNTITIDASGADTIIGEASFEPILNETWNLRADTGNNIWRPI